MRITRLIVLLMALITSIGFYMLYSYLTRDLESQTFQATEEALIDTGRILASHIEMELNNDEINFTSLEKSLKQAHQKEFKAKVHFLQKTNVGTHVYITDATGKVIFDSSEKARIGKDFSKYNDVLKSLKGDYGARSSRIDEADHLSSVLYIGSPIWSNEKIVGCLTVYKPQSDVRAFISSRRRWISLSISLIAFGIIVFTICVFTWIFRPIGKLTEYTTAITRGERPKLPHLGKGREANTLGKALEEMRLSLDGKSYIEEYPQILTHELKSPIAAIRGTAELLDEEMPAAQRQKFLLNIQHETNRSQRIIDGLLQLARLEAQPHLLSAEPIPLLELIEEVNHEHQQRIEPKSLSLETQVPDGLKITGDRNLLKAAISNLLENAIHFSPQHGLISIHAEATEDDIHIAISDQGPGIPDYALARVFERFYSLSKHSSKQKSSGLGLTFVKEIAELHHGKVTLANLNLTPTVDQNPSGAIATISLPTLQPVAHSPL